MSPLIGVKAVATWLGVAESWVYQRCEGPDPDLPHVRLGRYLKFEPTAISAYIRTHRQGGETGNGNGR